MCNSNKSGPISTGRFAACAKTTHRQSLTCLMLRNRTARKFKRSWPSLSLKRTLSQHQSLPTSKRLGLPAANKHYILLALVPKQAPLLALVVVGYKILPRLHRYKFTRYLEHVTFETKPEMSCIWNKMVGML